MVESWGIRAVRVLRQAGNTYRMAQRQTMGRNLGAQALVGDKANGSKRKNKNTKSGVDPDDTWKEKILMLVFPTYVVGGGTALVPVCKIR
mmetsp:Transcript_410/g.888  ORF Transcript_410/g.888 Transcript_410/m.888 type:complete len:90 (+) Transcript_410:681-950(+)